MCSSDLPAAPSAAAAGSPLAVKVITKGGEMNDDASLRAEVRVIVLSRFSFTSPDGPRDPNNACPPLLQCVLPVSPVAVLRPPSIAFSLASGEVAVLRKLRHPSIVGLVEVRDRIESWLLRQW